MSIKPKDRKARANYRKKVKRFHIDFYPTEADLIEHIEKQPKKQTYIKDLIRKDMLTVKPTEQIIEELSKEEQSELLGLALMEKDRAKAFLEHSKSIMSERKKRENDNGN